MTIRLARESDLPGILEITNREILEGYAHFGEEPMTIEELKASWQEQAKQYPWFVAGEVDGFARAYPWKPRSAYARTAEIGVYVRLGQQGKGIGRALYAALIPEMKAKGFHTLVAGIALPNEPSVRLHEALGMKHVGTLPQMGFKLGAWRDVGYWALVLE